ncbi:hypothetical protein K3G63_21070 [Hymenobacter sp. HSC-4F20]|uniref:hypothetical protein n=1 Tax=Hymenobacter sp. HSC-4F20 TaxID=2864135 RepID=UPI001C7317BB|nr:hypothetical protein [Hymenobacter sp. HSC-4F20]MBX0292948.1 hypothetical protein [Hymenobacter sp. HSC-4F20]
MRFFRLIVSLLLLPYLATPQTPRADLLLRNGYLYDGAGNAWAFGDVAVRVGKR